jgi:hypothetical protein
LKEVVLPIEGIDGICVVERKCQGPKKLASIGSFLLLTVGASAEEKTAAVCDKRPPSHHRETPSTATSGQKVLT